MAHLPGGRETTVIHEKRAQDSEEQELNELSSVSMQNALMWHKYHSPELPRVDQTPWINEQETTHQASTEASAKGEMETMAWDYTWSVWEPVLSEARARLGEKLYHDDPPWLIQR